MTRIATRSLIGAVLLASLLVHPQANAQALFVPTREFGADADGPIDALLVGSPRFVATGNGYVIVGDAAGGKVKVYDRDGGFRYVIDARGQGPGEIQRVSDAAVLGDNLWLIDELNMRVSVFALRDGGYIESFTPNLGVMPRGFELLPDHLVVLGKKRGDGGDLLLHEVDLDGNLVRSFGGFDETWSLSADVDATNIGAILPGSTCATPDGTLRYAPRLYSGRIFGFDRADGGWTASRELAGWLSVEKSYEVSSDGEVTFVADSRGLHCLADGRVLHFSMQGARDKQLYVELFSADAELLAATSVEGVRFPEREFWDFSVGVMAIDEVDDDSGVSVFVVDADATGAPRFREGRLNWDAAGW